LFQAFFNNLLECFLRAERERAPGIKRPLNIILKLFNGRLIPSALSHRRAGKSANGVSLSHLYWLLAEDVEDGSNGLYRFACAEGHHTILHPYVSIRAAVIRLNASPVSARIINRTGTYKSSWLSEAARDRSRLSGDQISLSDNKRWADSLDANFQSVLSQDLGIQLGTQRIVLFPWYGRPDIDYEVEVQSAAL
jgi:frataxin-like iron-binding protein CyaY